VKWNLNSIHGYKERVSLSYLKYCVYPQEYFNGKLSCLPGEKLESVIDWACSIEGADAKYLETKLQQSCRKLCYMWHAGEQAVMAEREFYSTTIQDAPALFGDDAVKIQYHLEAMVLFSRSALDIASTVFGWTLPDPFKKKRYDSFNSLVKSILTEDQKLPISSDFARLRDDKLSWLSMVSDAGKGRSLRDKLAHQMEFPIDYMELRANSEKEYPVVRMHDHYLPLDDFITLLRDGVISGFLAFENLCYQNLSDSNISE